MTKGKNFKACDAVNNAPWYRVYMFNDIRAVILPTGELVPLPHEDFSLGSFAVALCKDKIKEYLLDQ